MFRVFYAKRCNDQEVGSTFKAMYGAIDTKNYVEIVLTGGPCAGKTSALSYLSQHLEERGIKTLCAPELASIFINSGIRDLGALRNEDEQKYVSFQEHLMLMQGAMRKRFQGIAEMFAPQKVAIIYDRAEMDARSYLGDDAAFFRILENNGLTILDTRDSYDAVVHLRSAALGAAKHYSKSSNPARQEDVHEAAVSDQNTLDAWVGHPHLRIIDNSTDFETKLRRTFECVSNAIGVSASMEIERWFLLAESPDINSPEFSAAQISDIEQTYLLSSDGSEMRVRKRTSMEHDTYTWTQKLPVSDGVRVEHESLIDKRTYDLLLSERDPDLRTVKKRRYCFAFRNSYCELDHFYDTGSADIWLLEIEQVSKDDSVDIPDFLVVDREVTGESSYSTAKIAQIR